MVTSWILWVVKFTIFFGFIFINLKKSKAAGVDNIVAEHIVNSHPCLIIHLKLLFQMMLLHGYVPNFWQRYCCATYKG